MKKRKLNYRFHNPNSAAVTADYILRIFVESNQEKVHLAIQAGTGRHRTPEPERLTEGHTA